MPISGEKKVYYISMEFLIGKLLSNNLINLGIYGKLSDILEKDSFLKSLVNCTIEFLILVVLVVLVIGLKMK